MRRARAIAPLLIWLSLLSAVLIWLHRLGGPLAPPDPADAGEWMAARGPEVAVMMALRLGCLAVGWYLLVATSGAVVARWLQVPVATRVVESLTPPLVRRLVTGIAGVAMTATATTVASASAVAASEDSALSAVTASAGSDDEPTMRRLPDGSEEVRPTDQPAENPVEMRMLPPQPEPEPEPEPLARGVRRRTVVAGDHFWSIAESELVAARSHPVSDAEIDPYWRLLVEANRSEVVDPDLLFPGQVVEVPPVPPEAVGT